MEHPTPPESLRALASSEIYIKSRRTRRRFMPMLQANIEEALAATAPDAVVKARGEHEFNITATDLNAAAAAVATVFGIDRVDRVHAIAAPDLDTLAANVRELAAPAVTGKTFAARVRRNGKHEWKSTRKVWMLWDWLGWAVLSRPGPEQLLDRAYCSWTTSEHRGNDALIAVFLVEPETPSGSALSALMSAIPTDRWTTAKKRLLTQMLAVGEKMPQHRGLVLARISRFCGKEFDALEEVQEFRRSLDDSP